MLLDLLIVSLTLPDVEGSIKWANNDETRCSLQERDATATIRGCAAQCRRGRGPARAGGRDRPGAPPAQDGPGGRMTMNIAIADRLAAMLRNADLPAFEVEAVPVTYGPGADGCTRRSSFSLTRGGERYAEVSVEVHGTDATRLALVIWGLLRGSEGRLLDAEETIENLRHALEQRRRELSELQRRLADFETSRHVRGEFYAVADTTGRVWLCGRPSASSFGLQYESWGELARERPGLRPCGALVADGDTYVVMRPVADLVTPQEEARHG